MKRVVTGNNAQGRSFVLSSDELDEGSFLQPLWEFEATDLAPILAGIADGVAAEWLEPKPGGAKLMVVTIPPVSEAVELPPMQGIGEGGWHVTRTLDFVYVISGEIKLLLDEDDAHLESGDIVVLQASRHATRNESDAPAVLLIVLVTPP